MMAVGQPNSGLMAMIEVKVSSKYVAKRAGWGVVVGVVCLFVAVLGLFRGRVGGTGVVVIVYGGRGW